MEDTLKIIAKRVALNHFKGLIRIAVSSAIAELTEKEIIDYLENTVIKVLKDIQSNRLERQSLKT